MSARDLVIQGIYLAASVLFILGLKSLSHPDKARVGMQQAAVGMALAIIGTLFHHEIIRFDLIAVALILGTVIGYPLGMPVTVPSQTPGGDAPRLEYRMVMKTRGVAKVDGEVVAEGEFLATVVDRDR